MKKSEELYKRLDRILERIDPNSRMNYEELKIVIKLEDFFYDCVLIPLCKKHKFRIHFDERDIILNKQEELGNEA